MLRLELDWGDEADLAVQAAEVEPVDVLGDGDLQLVDVLPKSAVADELGLEQAVERLGHGIVVAVALASDRGDGTGLGEAFGVADGEVLHPSVGVVDEVAGVVAVVLPGPQAHVQRVQREIGAQRG